MKGARGTLAKLRIPNWAGEALTVALLLAWTGWVYAPLARGVPPTTTDHGFVLYRAIEIENLLGRGDLFGWSDLQYGGHPPALNYPIASALLTVALHALPGISLETAYAWSVLLCLWAMSLSLYFVGRLHFSRWTGVVAGALSPLDPGAWWMGGHHSALYVGMWIHTFSTAFLLAAIALWTRAIETGRARHIHGAGALLGVSVLLHPQVVILAVPAAMVMLLALAASPQPPPRAIAGRTLLAFATAFVVSAFWAMPFAFNFGYSLRPDLPPLLLSELWRDLRAGRWLDLPPLWTAASLVGVLLLAPRKDAFSRFVALTVPLFFVFFTREVLHLLYLRDPVHPGFVDVLQLPRVHFLTRPLATLAAAYALTVAIPRAFIGLGARRIWPAIATLALAALGTAFAMSSPSPPFPSLPADPSPQAPSPENRLHLDRALDAAVKLLEPGERIALRTQNPYDHSLVFAAAAKRLKILKIGRDAANPFVNRVVSSDPEVVTRVGAGAMVSLGPEMSALGQTPPERGDFGPFYVRRLLRRPRAWLDGPGNVEILSWTEDQIRLRVSGSRQGDRVRLGMGAYEGWRTSEGLPVEVMPLNGQPLAAIPARDGEIVLRYRGPRSQWLGWAITLLGSGTLIAYGRGRSRPTPTVRRGPRATPPPQQSTRDV